MRIEHIEQVLMGMHSGQWFGWSDSKNKVYKNLVIHGDYEKPSQEFLESETARLQAEYNATEYQRLRAPEYPPIGDQLDALLKHLNYRRTQGDELVQDLDDIIASWLSVKQRFPKND